METFITKYVTTFEKNSNLKCYKFLKEITTLNVVTFK